MVSVVYGVTQASTDGWGSSSAWPFIALGAVLLALFFVIEARVKAAAAAASPHRSTGCARAPTSPASSCRSGIFGMFLFMTFYFQNVHAYSAVKSGLLFLPFSLGVIVVGRASPASSCPSSGRGPWRPSGA